MGKKLTVILTIICILFAIVAGYSGYKIYTIQKGYNDAKAAYTEIQDNYRSKVNDDSEEMKQAERAGFVEYSPIHIDFEGMQQDVNEEIYAYLWCPDTVIDYPVVQHLDNKFYLDHNANKEYNLNGAIFIDCTNYFNFKDRNTVLHGHHMNDGSMFASLPKWYDEEYVAEHPVMYLNTSNSGNFRVDIFAAFTTPANSDAYLFDLSEEEMAEWLDWVKENSLIHPDVEVGPNDHCITMSTCAYSFSGARTVVIGKLVPIG